MDWTNETQRAAFFDLHSDNPREGPGNRDCTAQALGLVQLYGEADTILDLACGPGAQTIDLLELLPTAHVTAVDLNAPFVTEVQSRVAAIGASDRLNALTGDMLTPPARGASMDLIWCEGAAYIIGVENALRTWRDFLKPHGMVAFTECVFLRDDLPKPVVENWAEYPEMRNVAGVNEWIDNAGYDTLAHFVLPAPAWWAYYEPLQERVTKLKEKYQGNADATLVIDEGQSEIDVYREYSEYFGYAFYITRMR